MPCFNTQPPEGGWLQSVSVRSAKVRFNTQPPEGGWAAQVPKPARDRVSTHSRPKAAGPPVWRICILPCSFNTQPPEGGWVKVVGMISSKEVSTHSRPKAAGCLVDHF